jgi:hypothetical protein
MITVPVVSIVCAVLLALAVGVVVGWLVRGRSATWCNACGQPVGYLCPRCWRTRPEFRVPASTSSAAEWR